MYELIPILAFLLTIPAQAQNTLCPTRPVGDTSNACASTAFINSSSTGIFTLPHTWTAIQTHSTQIYSNIPSLITTNTTGGGGSAGEGAIYVNTTRTGGYGQYGNLYLNYTITAATPAGQFDISLTSFATHTNLTGGQVLGLWTGSNTPAAYLGQTYSSGAAIGQELNVGNRWADFGYQTELGGTRYTVGQQIVPDVIPAADGINSTSVSNITIGAAADVTVISHGYSVNTPVIFGGAGTIPGGLVKGTVYYVSSTGLTTNTFKVTAVRGSGTTITTSGSFAAPITIQPSYPGTFAQAIGHSIWGHQWHVGGLIVTDTIATNGVGYLSHGASNSGSSPAYWSFIDGTWGTGLDFTTATFTTTSAIKMHQSQAFYIGGAYMTGDGAGSYIYFGQLPAFGSSTGVMVANGTSPVTIVNGLSTTVVVPCGTLTFTNGVLTNKGTC